MYSINYRKNCFDNWRVCKEFFDYQSANKKSLELIEQGFKVRLFFVSEIIL